MIAIQEHCLFLGISISFEFLWSSSSKEAQSIYSNSFVLALSIPYLNVFQVNGTMQKHTVSELSKSFQIAKTQQSKTSLKKNTEIGSNIALWSRDNKNAIYQNFSESIDGSLILQTQWNLF